MLTTNLGDLSLSFSGRQQNTALRQQIDKLTTELATGQVADVRDVLQGNFSYLTDLERRGEVLNGYNVATTEATIFTQAQQNALDRIAGFAADLSPSLLAAGSSAIGISGANTAAEARSALEGIIGAVNTDAANRFVFAGTATGQAPLPDADTLLTALRAATAGSTTPDDLLLAAATWFDDPAGFDAQVYQGSATGLAPFDLSQTDRVNADLRATDPNMKAVVTIAAVADLANDPAFGFDVASQAELLDKAGQALLVAQDGMVDLQARVGFVEARIEKIGARNAAEQTSMEFAKSALLAVDPFEAATRLEEAQFQLQSLYSVTVRMSQLSLVNFL